MHNCDGIGIEASPAYAALAAARLERWKVFAELAEPAQVATGQRSLFEED